MAAAEFSWQRQLVAVWACQFLSITAFCFGLPFAAYYIQTFGVEDREAVVFWTAVFQAAGPLAFMFGAPFWGIMADRFGRKAMLVRANVCAAAVLLGMGLAPNLGILILCRVGQGLFTGIMPAAKTLVAVSTPEQWHGLALGSLSAAVFSGAFLGLTIGGYTAEHVGYRESFYVGAALSLVAALIALFGTQERRAQRPTPSEVTAVQPARFASLKPGFPLLILITATAWAMQFDLPILPLVIQDLQGGLEGSALAMGKLNATGCVGSVIAGTLMGWLIDRFRPTVIASISAIGAAAACIPFAFALTLGLHPLYAVKFALAFFATGLDPAFQAWLSKITAPERRGVVFGWASTAASIGWMGAPITSAALVTIIGLTNTYFIQAALFLLLIPITIWAARKMARPTG